MNANHASTTAALADELRRLPCRVVHDEADIERCPRCRALAAYDAEVATNTKDEKEKV